MTNQAPPPPPPPPAGGMEFKDPFASSGSNGTLDAGRPAVAAAPGRVFIVLGIVLTIFVFIIYQLFIAPDTKDPIESDEQVPITQTEDNELVEEPPVLMPEADFELPPPPAVGISAPPIVQPEADGPNNELRQARIRSSMLITGGSGGILPEFGKDEGDAADDQNLQFASRVYASNTKAQKAKATHIGNLQAVVAQGRLIQAVLETAINTELPGSIRAIVSRDVYPEGGSEVIIPKGSRLIGQYNSSVFSGQSRVYVVWTRVIRPDGVDVMVNSPLIDQIGQAGVGGHVDTRFGEIFARALLTSAISIAVAAVVDEANGDEISSTTTNTDGSTTTSGDLTTQASVEAVENFGDIMTTFLRRFIDVQPTILVDQGTPVNVFVNRDLLFPSWALGARIIP